MTHKDFTAHPEDGKDILRILESSPAKGSIELLYTRRPDAYASYMKEPGEARVFVSREDECVVGTCAELIREVYIGGKVCRAAYLCGLKKDADHNGHSGLGPRFIHGLVRDDIDFYYCSVISDNTDARQMFEKGTRMLRSSEICEYTTYILTPKNTRKRPQMPLSFRRACKYDEDALLDFLNAEGSKYDLFPVIRSFDELCGLSVTDFYILFDESRIVAAAALWNISEYKQYVVKKYRGIMKAARLFNPILPLLGYVRLPKENVTMDFPMLSFFLSTDDCREYYESFLNEINREIKKSYGMYVIGLPRTHFATEIFSRKRCISFNTKIYDMHFSNALRIENVDGNHIFFECAML